MEKKKQRPKRMNRKELTKPGKFQTEKEPTPGSGLSGGRPPRQTEEDGRNKGEKQATFQKDAEMKWKQSGE